MGRSGEEHDRRDEPTPEEDTDDTPGTDEVPDSEDDESSDRLDAWLMQELDRSANDIERLDEAAKPLGRVNMDPGMVIKAEEMRELGRAGQLGPVQIDNRMERMDDEDAIPKSEYGLFAETKIRIVEATLTEQETADLLSAGWIAVQRDQLKAIAETIDGTGINSVQAIAIVMMLVGKQIGEYRIRDLMETMTQVTEVPAQGIQCSKPAPGP